jgi:DNA-binding YbaB/EbfC family protein
MKNIAGLMKQASQMQAKMAEMQARVEAAEVQGQSGAGMVIVTLGGKGLLRGIKIDPKLADPSEMEMLQDLIVSAHADAKRKLDDMMAEEMSKVTGGMDLPAGLKLPF